MSRPWHLQWADYYDVLEVAHTARSEVIDAAYRRLAALSHADTATGSDDRMQALSTAHDVLTDSSLRAEYDHDYLARLPNDAVAAPGTRAPDDAVAGAPQDHPRATTALVLGIVSLFIFGVVLGAVAFYMGSKAEREIAASGGSLTGANRARWGKNLGIAGIILWAILLIMSFTT